MNILRRLFYIQKAYRRGAAPPGTQRGRQLCAARLHIRHHGPRAWRQLVHESRTSAAVLREKKKKKRAVIMMSTSFDSRIPATPLPAYGTTLLFTHHKAR